MKYRDPGRNRNISGVNTDQGGGGGRGCGGGLERRGQGGGGVRSCGRGGYGFLPQDAVDA